MTESNVIKVAFGRKSSQFKEIIPKIREFFCQRLDRNNTDDLVHNVYVVIVGLHVVSEIALDRDFLENPNLIQPLLFEGREDEIEYISQFISSNTYKSVSNVIKNRIGHQLQLDLS